MARIYIGEKLIRKVIFVEPEDWKVLEQIAKEENLSVAQCLRIEIAKIAKYKRIKNQAKPVLEQPGEAQN